MALSFDSFTLAASTADLADEPAAREHADVVEFRMDLAADPLAALDAYDGSLPLLVTNRVDWEGGEADAAPARLDALETACGRGFVAAVDVELDALRGKADYDASRVVERARATDTAVVVSVHDFEGAPDRPRLKKLLRAACDRGDVGKAAITASQPEDVLDMLQVTRSLTREGEAVATMAMGEAGRHSRAVAPLYGSRIGYAPVDPADATAPGQFDLATLRTLVDELQARSESGRPASRTRSDGSEH